MHSSARSVYILLFLVALSVLFLAAAHAGASPPTKPLPLGGGIGVDVVVTKQLAAKRTTPGAMLRYDLSVSNATTTVARGVVVTEVVPAGTMFDPFAVTATGWSCPGGVVAGTRCFLDAGDLGGFVRFGFPVRVVDILPAGVEGVVTRRISRSPLPSTSTPTSFRCSVK